MRNESQRFISTTMEKTAVDLFLRQIGIMPESKYFDSEALRQVISSYIAARFKVTHCCVLWYKTMEDPDNPIVMYLKKNNIDTKYERFSIIITPTILRFSQKQSADVRKVFEDPHPVHPRFNTSAPAILY